MPRAESGGGKPTLRFFVVRKNTTLLQLAGHGADAPGGHRVIHSVDFRRKKRWRVFIAGSQRPVARRADTQSGCQRFDISKKGEFELHNTPRDRDLQVEVGLHESIRLWRGTPKRWNDHNRFYVYCSGTLYQRHPASYWLQCPLVSYVKLIKAATCGSCNLPMRYIIVNPKTLLDMFRLYFSEEIAGQHSLTGWQMSHPNVITSEIILDP